MGKFVGADLAAVCTVSNAEMSGISSSAYAHAFSVLIHEMPIRAEKVCAVPGANPMRAPAAPFLEIDLSNVVVPSRSVYFMPPDVS